MSFIKQVPGARKLFICAAQQRKNPRRLSSLRTIPKSLSTRAVRGFRFPLLPQRASVCRISFDFKRIGLKGLRIGHRGSRQACDASTPSGTRQQNDALDCWFARKRQMVKWFLTFFLYTKSIGIVDPGGWGHAGI
jgi:hypothetical protein